jgi:hypothetical protein
METKMTTDAVGAAPGSRWFRVACWLWIATGIGHTVGNHTSLGPRPTAEELALRAAMQEVRLSVAAPLQRSVWQGFVGDSLSLGLMLVGFGAVQLICERALRRRGIALPRALLVANLAVALTSLAITARCFPLQPLVGLLVMIVAYGVALALRLRG